MDNEDWEAAPRLKAFVPNSEVEIKKGPEMKLRKNLNLPIKADHS
jgi:hypothetical protein